MPKIKLLEDLHATGPVRTYPAGSEIEVDNADAARLVAEGKAEYCLEAARENLAATAKRRRKGQPLPPADQSKFL